MGKNKDKIKELEKICQEMDIVIKKQQTQIREIQTEIKKLKVKQEQAELDSYYNNIEPKLAPPRTVRFG